jgi:hypothetical protein
MWHLSGKCSYYVSFLMTKYEMDLAMDALVHIQSGLEKVLTMAAHYAGLSNVLQSVTNTLPL